MTWVEDRKIEREIRRSRLLRIRETMDMNVKEDNGLLRGLERDICDFCGFGLTRLASVDKMTRCPECGKMDFHVLVGNKPPRPKPGQRTTQKGFITNKSNGGNKDMANKIKIAELKKLLAEAEAEDKDSEEETKTDESLVIEQANSGKGFAIWRDYAKDETGKLKRLTRTD